MFKESLKYELLEKENQKIIQSIYRPEIDGLRAFAVVAVIINHFNKEILPSGYLGVDIFFVISGYVITSSLAGRKSRNLWNFLSDFYKRRIKRLIPALVAFVFSTSILICFFNPSPGFSLWTGISSLFGLSNIYLLIKSTDYFSQSTELNVFTHTWSLGVEEQFYFLFPFLVWFTGFSRQTPKGSRNLFISILFLAICSLISFIFLYLTNQPSAYFLMPTRFWELAIGCLLFLIIQKRGTVFNKSKEMSPQIVFIAIIGVMFLPTSFAIISTILIVFLSFLLISCLREGNKLFRILSNRKVVFVGLISYPLYLWHWGILSISRWTIGIHWWSLPFQITIIFVLSACSYKWIEQPFRDPSNKYSGKMIFAFGIGSLITTAISIYSLLYKNGPNLYLGVIGPQNNALIDFNDKSLGLKASECHSRRSKIINIKNSKTVNNCLYKSNNKDRFISLLGDSHALAYMPTISNIAKITDSSYFHFSKDSCGLIIEPDPNSGCANDVESSINLIKEISKDYKKKTLIIAKSFANFYSQEQKNLIRDQLISISEVFKESEVNIILTLPIIQFDSFPGSPICLQQWFSQKNKRNILCFENIKKNEFFEKRKSFKNFLESIAENNKNISLFDPVPLLCDSELCSPIKEGSYIYQDGNHLSEASKIWLTYPLIEHIDNL